MLNKIDTKPLITRSRDERARGVRRSAAADGILMDTWNAGRTRSLLSTFRVVYFPVA